MVDVGMDTVGGREISAGPRGMKVAVPIARACPDGSERCVSGNAKLEAGRQLDDWPREGPTSCNSPSAKGPLPDMERSAGQCVFRGGWSIAQAGRAMPWSRSWPER